MFCNSFLNSVNYVLCVDSCLKIAKGFGRLSLVAASAAQSAASVVQTGTKEFTSKVTNYLYSLLDLHRVCEISSYCVA
jgi:hypothetical protein